MSRTSNSLIIALGLFVSSGHGADVMEATEPSFSRDVLPLLSEHCFQCHGMDSAARQAGLRLDQPDGLFDGESAIIIPGNAAASPLMARLLHSDPAQRMPPIEMDDPLSPEDIDLLRRWIDAGATWETHWAFVPPAQVEPPQREGVSNPIDAFIQARLTAEGLEAAPPAPDTTRLRRLSLDLTGLPPTLDVVDQWLADPTEDNWQRQIDRLMAAPEYGQHQARFWLDAARYADTHGYHLDNERTMWKYRDHVVDSFNTNQPFDEFTIEAIAGDLLPEPTLQQRVASGFNRCLATTNEGGAIKAEYRVKYGVDRVETTSTIWMGLTTGCAACHDHKFDPISQREFYQLFAFFNNTVEDVMDGNAKQYPPVIAVPNPEQADALGAIDVRRAEAQAVLNAPGEETLSVLSDWVVERTEAERARWAVVEPLSITTSSESVFERQIDGSYLVSGPPPGDDHYEIIIPCSSRVINAIRLEAMRDPGLPYGGPGLNPDNGNIVLTEIEFHAFPSEVGLLGSEEEAEIDIIRATADHSQPNYDITATIDGDRSGKNGWAILKDGKPGDRVAVFQPNTPVEFADGGLLRIRMDFQSIYKNHSIGRLRIALSSDPQDAPSQSGDWEYAGPFPAESVEALHEARFQPEHEEAEAQPSWDLKPEYIDATTHAFDTAAPAAHYLRRTIQSPTDRVLRISLGSDDGLDVILNGERVHENNTPRGAGPDQDTVDLALRAGANELILRIDNYGGASGFYYRPVSESVAGGSPAMSGILSTAPDKRTDEQRKTLRDHWLRNKWEPGIEAGGKLDAADAERTSLMAMVPTTYVSQELETPRTTTMLMRGQYDQPGEEVAAGTPAFLPPMEDSLPRNRLGLARWLVDPGHPLTARVTVNRIWQQYFGTGLVETTEDFGVQGRYPSHPELLDWLALWFIEHEWDLQALHRLIVSSAAYQQSSVSTETMRAIDPESRLLARFPRHRLDAEVVRDQALFVSGLLVDDQGGPGVKPYQPTGLWKAVGYSGSNTVNFVPDTDDSLWRRSVYTFWKRTSPPPAMTLLDAPSREFCTVRRERTNTPLAALLLLNDEQYVEAARAMGQRIMTEGGSTDADRVVFAFRLATSRRPTDQEQAVLLSLYAEQYAEFASDIPAATMLLEFGAAPRDDTLDPAAHAAWSIVANLILNLDETISKG
ncbi:MAG: PSD1 and planctomycete cytochrome C domain-containing protein [Phycisphaerales bacterium]|nr:PSD1 and planctomycete cytochrome C domain-containing protein [Phycisphaerales bacterium]